MKRAISYIFIIFFLFILLSIQVYGSESTQNKTVVLFGDSNTKGSNWSLNKYNQETKWASVLNKKRDKWKIVNKGVEGNTTEHARRRFNQDVISYNPNIVIIMFGTNDVVLKNGKPNVSFSRFKENLEFFLNRLKEQNSEVLLMTAIPIIEGNGNDGYYFSRHKKEEYKINQPKYILNKYNHIVRKIAFKQNVSVVDLYAIFIKKAGGSSDKHLIHSGLLDSSGTHMTPKGAKVVADEVLKKIR
jgi:isoamyl acetate esterase